MHGIPLPTGPGPDGEANLYTAGLTQRYPVPVTPPVSSIPAGARDHLEGGPRKHLLQPERAAPS